MTLEHKRPGGWSLARSEGLAITEAAAIWVAYSTAYGALIEKARMRPGDDVLIPAASGGVGRAAMQIANQIGAVPIAITRPTPFPTSTPLTIFSYRSFEHTLDTVVVKRMAAFLNAGVRLGALRPAIDKVFAIDDVVDAHRHLEKGLTPARSSLRSRNGPERAGQQVVAVLISAGVSVPWPAALTLLPP
ncbi:hypothetical protein ACQP2U_32940 [Nocardia sp. CA-084685]|uniref:hypothetical protein n=1 Tax=Nocardia sp. CA-084685 TaxID=3239970 RepID=UPI003D995925